MARRPAAAGTRRPIRRPARNVRMIYLSPMIGKTPGKRMSAKMERRLQFGLLPDDDLGADRHALIEVGDIGIDQPEAAGGHRGADRVGPVGAVDAVDRG